MSEKCLRAVALMIEVASRSKNDVKKWRSVHFPVREQGFSGRDAERRNGFLDAQDVLASALPQDAVSLADVPLNFFSYE